MDRPLQRLQSNMAGKSIWKMDVKVGWSMGKSWNICWEFIGKFSNLWNSQRRTSMAKLVAGFRLWSTFLTVPARGRDSATFSRLRSHACCDAWLRCEHPWSPSVWKCETYPNPSQLYDNPNRLHNIADFIRSILVVTCESPPVRSSGKSISIDLHRKCWSHQRVSSNKNQQETWGPTWVLSHMGVKRVFHEINHPFWGNYPHDYGNPTLDLSFIGRTNLNDERLTSGRPCSMSHCPNSWVGRIHANSTGMPK